MKAIFCKFFSFFLQFSRRRQGEGKDAPHQGRRICQKIADFQHPGTDEPEIEHPAPKEKEDPVQPDLPPPCLLRPDEQRHCHNDPEGQIQHRPQQGQGHPDPEDTEQVIQQPHRQPQRRRLGQGPAAEALCQFLRSRSGPSHIALQGLRLRFVAHRVLLADDRIKVSVEPQSHKIPFILRSASAGHNAQLKPIRPQPF